MDNLSIFQAPVEDEVTLCEVEGRLYSVNYNYANISAFTTATEKHPDIHITGDMIHSQRRGDEAKSLFLPVEEPFLKRLVQAYYEQGISEVLNTAKDYGPVVISKIASIVVDLLRGISRLQCRLTSKPIENTVSLMSDISQTRFWLQSTVRCIAWHDYHMKIAVATCDDAVRIYSNSSTVTPILRHKQQTNITCLAWRPLSNMEIAVGCENGILIWNVDHNSLINKHSINNVTLLQRINHKPVVSLSWNNGGDILASVAACDSRILIWNVELDATSSLQEPSGYGNYVLKWSPKGNKLITATSSLLLRIWDCETWTAERWTVLSGRIQACCWSPCGNIVLFVTNTDPIIYALSFIQSEIVFANSKYDPNQSIPVYDVSKGDINGFIVGGVIINMEWDPKKNYVAALFRDTNYVAIFRVSVRPTIKLHPCCLLAGCPEEKPVCIAFQGNFSPGVCLSIAWSSGRIQHFPIIHSEMETIANNSLTCMNSSSFYHSFNAHNTSLNTTYF